MLMNSVHEQCPNSDPKQCTVTKLGCVHSAHTQKPGRESTLRAQCPGRGRCCARNAQVVGAAARAMPRSWALLRAQPTGRAHVTGIASAGRALSVRRSRAKRAQVAR